MDQDEPEIDRTNELLQRWHGGERAALDELLRRDLEWLRRRVSQRLGDQLRRHGDTQDYLHDAVVEVLRFAPRFVVASQRQFRELIGRIVENTLRDRRDFFTAKRRDLHRQAALPDDTVLQLDPGERSVTRPSEQAARHEEQAWLRLALDVMHPDDREVVVLRQWEGLTFAELGARLGLAEDAARMRFNRALARLASAVDRLQRGEV